MKQFLKSLLKSDGETSSKRFTAIVSLLLLTTCIIAHLFGVQIDHEVLYTLSALICSCLGMTLISKANTG